MSTPESKTPAPQQQEAGLEGESLQMKSANPPAFSLAASPMQRVEAAQGGMSVNRQGTVTEDGLRVRSKPGTQYPEISGALLRGTAVHVTAIENGWYRISQTHDRWVFGQYVNTSGTPLMSVPPPANMTPISNVSQPPPAGVDINLVLVTDATELAALRGAQVPNYGGQGANATTLTGSVGKGGANNADDVAAVQTRLNNAGAGIRVTGQSDRVLENAIFMYQKGRGGRGDGRVDPNGGTWTALVAGEFQFSSITNYENMKEDLAPAGICREDEVEATYGNVDNIPLVPISLPFPLMYGTTAVSRASVHRDAAPSLSAALSDVLAHYGLEEIRRLRIDANYAGTYNKRTMRGGSGWSMHAYGIAIDLNHSENQLSQTASTALFAKPEYRALLDIMERHGWYSLGRAKNYDYMHFQRAFPI